MAMNNSFSAKINTQQINIIFISLLMSVFLTACDEEERISLSEDSIIYCAEGSPETFNPQLVTSGTTIDATSNQLYDRLISLKTNEEGIVPSIAKSWHVTRDGKLITFYLRKDVSFHNTDYFTPTRKLNADDVLFSFNRIIDKNNQFYSASGGKYPFFQGIKFAELVEQVEKINDYTVRFHLKHTDSSFLSNLATDFAVILSAEYAAQLAKTKAFHEIDIYPIGTGPFKLKEYHVSSHIRYYRHEEYWQGKAKIKQLIFDITPSTTGRLTKLLAKECDVVGYPIAHKKIKERPDLILEEITSFNVGYLGFNTRKAPFDNKLVRQAISYAINKQTLIDTVYHGNADIAKSLLPPASWAYDKNSKGQVYDLDKAKALLTEAGYPNGFTMDIWAMPVQRAYNPNAITMAKIIQSDLKSIGVKVHIVSYEWSAFLKRLSLGEHQSFLLGWSADHPDPDNFFTPILSCSNALAGTNRTFWCNEKYNKLIEKALITSNINRRKKLYHQALQLIAEEVPLLPIAHSKRFQARNNEVKGEILTSFGGISFHTASKQPSVLFENKETDKNTEAGIK